MARKRVVAYVRVSSASKAQLHSYEFQEQYWQNKFENDPENELICIYADRGISGSSAYKRPEFVKMLQDARTSQFDVIHTKSVSRFARNTVELLEAVRELRDLGIEVIFENENIDTMTPGGEVLLTILAAMAEQESRTMSTNIKWSYQKKFQNGEVILNTGMVLGYKKDGNGEYVIAEDEAETVRRIYREYIAGTPAPQICRELEADGITTKRGSTRWRPNAVLGILKNEKYTGNAILGKTFKPDVLSKRRMKNTGQSPMYYAENTHPAIIDQDIFDMAQAEMQCRRDEKDAAVGSSRYTSKYPFSGLLVCSICGHRLRRYVRTVGSGKRVAAWGCTNRISNGRSACNSHHINEDVLERTFRAAFDEIDEILNVVEDSCAEVLDSGNHAELDRVQQDIIEIQEAVLALHKAQQQGAVSEMDCEIKIAAYS